MDSVPSASGLTMVSKKGMDPSSLLSSTVNKVMVVGAKALGASLGEATTGADLGGSSPWFNNGSQEGDGPILLVVLHCKLIYSV